MTDWQSTRSMTPEELDEALTRLRMSRAALARFLDLDPRQVYRWAHGHAPIPTTTALLLSSMIAHGDKPLVPDLTTA